MERLVGDMVEPVARDRQDREHLAGFSRSIRSAKRRATASPSWECEPFDDCSRRVHSRLRSETRFAVQVTLPLISERVIIPQGQ